MFLLCSYLTQQQMLLWLSIEQVILVCAVLFVLSLYSLAVDSLNIRYTSFLFSKLAAPYLYVRGDTQVCHTALAEISAPFYLVAQIYL